MALFIVGSILAGTSRTLHQMIFYRLFRVSAAAGLMPCSQAIARETFPPAEQGMAMAISPADLLFVLRPPSVRWVAESC